MNQKHIRNPTQLELHRKRLLCKYMRRPIPLLVRQYLYIMNKLINNDFLNIFQMLCFFFRDFFFIMVTLGMNIWATRLGWW